MWEIPVPRPGRRAEGLRVPAEQIAAGDAVGTRCCLLRRAGARRCGASDLSVEVITAAVKALLGHIVARRPRDLVVETINGQSASTSPHASAFTAAGLRLTTTGLRYYASL